MKTGVIGTFILLITVCACKNVRLRDIKPENYTFQNHHIQTNWEEFRQLENCKKVEFIDSVYTLYIKVLNNKDSNSINDVVFDTTLVSFNNGKIENFYYWIFREIEEITNKGPNAMVDHFGYYGTDNNQVIPYYYPPNDMEKFKKDIKIWKDSIGCE